MKNIIINEIKKSIEVKNKILISDVIVNQIEYLSQEIIRVLKEGGKVIFCGNGGSFADSQHLAAEFISRLRIDRSSLPAIALGTNSSNITAISNDYGYENIFSRELSAIGNPIDILIPISTSGNSENIINVIEYANQNSIKVIGLTGNTGGKMGKKCQVIKVPSEMTEKIQECHIMIGHIICYITEKILFNN